MAIRDWFRSLGFGASGGGRSPGVRASAVTLHDLNDPVIAEFMRGEMGTASGATVTRESAMRVAAVYACVRIIAGAVSSMPIKLYRQDGRKRVGVDDESIARLISRKPNQWQTSKQWRHLMQAHMLLNGNGYSLIAGGRKRPLELYPLDPARMNVEQRPDLSLRYSYQRKNGSLQEFSADEILHLRGLSLDGYTGLSVLSYARESIGLSLQGEAYGAAQHKNGMRIGTTLKLPGVISPEAYQRLKSGLDEYRGANNAHKNLILEEGADFVPQMSNVDAQWLESRKFQRGDIFMFFGVPPFMAGDTDKATSWGTGLEQQSQGFVSYTLDDWLTGTEETLNTVFLPPNGSMYFKHTRASLVRGDIKTRYGAYATGLTNGFLTPNECREMEELPPIDGGDTLRVPLNTAPINAPQDNADEPPTTP